MLKSVEKNTSRNVVFAQPAAKQQSTAFVDKRA
jgi:hypothetical protein